MSICEYTCITILISFFGFASCIERETGDCERKTEKKEETEEERDVYIISVYL